MPELTLFDPDLQLEIQLPVQAPRSAPPRPRQRTAERRPTLLVLDGNSLAHRAYHAYEAEGLTTADGRPLGAVYGFLALLTGICERVGPAAVVVGFDCRSDASWRRAHYPEYKAQRPEKDVALTQQLDDLACLLDRLGVAVVCPDGWEADDVLGSGASAGEAADWDVVIATSDRDAFALISERTTVLRLGAGLDRASPVTPATLLRATGVRPSQYTEFAALRGDTSDNLPGIPGIGPKKAALLLREYGTVDAAVADPIGCRSVLGKRQGQALLDDVAEPEQSVFRRNMTLMAIRRDLPIDLEAARPNLTPEQVERHLLAWELPTLVRRVQVALALRPDLPPPPGDEHAPPPPDGW